MLTESDFMLGKNQVIEMIKRECSRQGVIQKEQVNYIIATVEHETNNTFMPVVEAYWKSDRWRQTNLRYYPYYGRGLVQITWKENYDKFSKLLNVDLVKHPDLALEMKHAVFILVHGMRKGLFTGKSLDDYINENKTDYIGARKIINGVDRAAHIADIAIGYSIA